MSDTRHSNGPNGAPSGPERQGQRSLGDLGRQIHQDAHALAAAVQDAADAVAVIWPTWGRRAWRWLRCK